MTLEYEYPTSTKTNQGNLLVGAATLHEAVDDPQGAPDDDTTYGGNNDGTNANDDVNTPDPTLSNFSSGNSVLVFIRIRDVGAGGSGRPLLYVGTGSGTRYGSGSNSPGSSYTNYTTTWNNNPATSSAWTEAEMNGTDATNPYNSIGIRMMTGVGEEIRDTQNYVCFDYTETAGGLSIPVAMHHYTKNIGMRC